MDPVPMKEQKEGASRRDFFRSGAMAAIPFLIPAAGLGISLREEDQDLNPEKTQSPLNFVFDGPWFSPQAYMEKLQEIDRVKPIEPDLYSSGGVTRELEEEFARITGKEKAIYLPTGTMANQVAMKLLNGNLTKVFVPENSHIFRDEADAAQSVHRLRPIPLGKGKPYFELEELKDRISYLDENEVFKSGPGTVVIENPVRRADGTVVPIETIKELTSYCRDQGYKLHLDGARIHIASAYSGVPVLEYASHFDTVYVSLYKYLNAAGGGILCGETELIDQVPHQIKILGGNMLHSWINTAMALHYLQDVDEQWDRIIKVANTLINEVNQLEGISITPLKNGSNVYDLHLAENIQLKEFTTYMLQEHRLEAVLSEANRGISVFYGHGDSDPIVPVRLGQQAAAKLEQLGYPVEWRTYPMQHSVCPEEIQHLAAWMQKRF
jgi:threonine aldolase